MATQARSSSGTSPGFKHDAFISYTTVDRVWATRLHSDLTQRGFNIAADFTVTEPGRSWKEVLDDALDTSRTLLVLWSPRAAEAQGMHLELAAYLALMRRDQIEDRGRRKILPVFLNKDLIAGAPPELASRQGVIVGTNATSWDSPGWADAIDRISEALAHKPLDASSPPIAPTAAGIPLRNIATLATSEGSERCWQLTEDLVVAATDQSALPDHELAVITATGTSLGTRKPWKELGDVHLDGLLAFQLEPPLEMRHPPPTASPSPGQIIDLWEPQFASPTGRAVIETALLGGAFRIRVLEGNGRTGAIGWDPSSQRAVVIVFRANEGPLGFPLEEIPRLAGSSQREGASPPPSARVHDDGWTIDDRLDHALYARAITEFIQHADTKPPLAIGVQGPWGQGKTSLMRMVQARLDPGHPDLIAPPGRSSGGPDRESELTFLDLRDSLAGEVGLEHAQPAEIRTVWFNAWKYQSSESLWAGLAHSILAQLPSRLPKRESELFWLRLQLRRIDAAAVRQDIHRFAFEWLLPRLIGLVALAFVAAALAVEGVLGPLGGIGGCAAALIYTAASWWKAQEKALDRRLEGSYLRYVNQPDYDGKLGYLHQVEEDMREALDLLTPDDRPTVIFIDDLDRCSPAKIGQVLEAINLFLSGEYPNCIFVLGIDDEVVAAAMEIVHSDVIARLERRRSEMGWRFMDKFIQLSFPMPRLTEGQKDTYLDWLLGGGLATPSADLANPSIADAEEIRDELRRGDVEPSDAARRIGKLATDLTAVERAKSPGWNRIAEEVISFGARDFSDKQGESSGALRRQLRHLSDNPRTIKRAVNLYRFYQFTAWARDASSLDLDSADPDLIARWIVIAVRWPQVVRWLQVNGQRLSEPKDLVRDSWQEDEPELCSFLESSDAPDLARAGACGLW